MKFAIFSPRLDGYWKEDGTIRHNWKKARVFLSREDAEAYLKWIETEHKHAVICQDLIVEQVE